jgi:tRNA pseudouridine55 synthase
MHWKKNSHQENPQNHLMIQQSNTADTGTGGIVLFAKRPGSTSFSSLFTIKHALNTSKVGHTGTLDSFASGLLVVCTGQLTHLVSCITEFDKSYDAVVEFGRETDTLEWTGNTVRTAPFPEKSTVVTSIAALTGKLMQKPPLFSALHVNGERASSIARSGRQADIPARPVTVFRADIEEFQFTSGGKVQAVRIRFSVSKGTYIRSLARDIGNACGSAAHLAGLRRLSVGNFRLEDAAGAALLSPFTIKNVYESITVQLAVKTAESEKKTIHIEYSPDKTELMLQKEVCGNLHPMTELLASVCGFGILHLREELKRDFLNGKPLKEDMFVEKNEAEVTGCKLSVFSWIKKEFLGMIKSGSDGKYSYIFVRRE